jgi:hypothetical protein
VKSIEIAPLSETELELTRALINSVLSTSATIDKVATWLLAGLGATVALIVANLDKTSSLVGVEQLREVIMLLLAAGLFGFAEKYLAIRVHINLHIDQQIRNSRDEIIENHKIRQNESGNINVEFDPMKSLLEIQKIVPWYQRRNYSRAFENGLKDPLYGHKCSAHFYNMQVLYATLQLVFSVVAIFFIAVNT